MQYRKDSGASEWGDPYDAPELTDEVFDNAEVYTGQTFVRRVGCPRSSMRKEQVSVRLDPDVLATLRASEPLWQTFVNLLPRQALGLEKAGTRAVG